MVESVERTVVGLVERTVVESAALAQRNSVEQYSSTMKTTTKCSLKNQAETEPKLKIQAGTEPKLKIRRKWDRS